MNTERIISLADYIESLPHLSAYLDPDTSDITKNHFAMYVWASSMAEIEYEQTFSRDFIKEVGENNCGTAGCIAGCEYILFHGQQALAEKSKLPYWEWISHVSSSAVTTLELSEDQANELFIPKNLDVHKILPSTAAAVLRRLARDGKVEWPEEDK